MYRILNAQVQERSRTPFYDQLKNYVWMAKDSWHTPGHSSGESLRGSPWVNDFCDFMGEHIFDADLSVSVKMLDSLMEPTGVIAEAQTIAAKAFGARRTFFATNGTSTSNKVIFQTLLAPGEKLLLDRNCHKSVHHGVVLSGGHPVYLDSSINAKYSLYGPVPKKTILSAIRRHPDAQAIILTSCTYDGLCYDLASIVEAAHAKGIKVIVDEAWYGFARFHPAFRPTALEAGADYASQRALFDRCNIQVEKSTFTTLPLLLTIGTTRSKVSRLYDALMRIAREGRAPRRLYRFPEIPGFTLLRYLPRDAFYCGGELVPLVDEKDNIRRDLLERACADQIVPYPPGIPVLVPGQVITREIVHYLVGLLRSQKRVELHGIVYDGYLPCLRVLKPAEERSLRRIG